MGFPKGYSERARAKPMLIDIKVSSAEAKRKHKTAGEV